VDVPFDDHSSYFDFYVYVSHYAPNFPEEDCLINGDSMDLSKAFELLRYGLRFVRPKLDKKQCMEAEELLNRAEGLFLKGPDAGGLQMLYDYEPKLFGRGR